MSTEKKGKWDVERMRESLKGIRGIIFDYGGTLDTGGDHWSHLIEEAYSKAGVAVDHAVFREAYVYAERELARERHILPEHDFRDLLDIKIKIELEWLVRNGLFAPQEVDGKAKEIAADCYDRARANVAKAEPVLRRLSEKYPLVLVSNFYGNISRVLEDFGIGRYFKAVIESAVVGIRKPDPRIFLKGVEALGLRPDEVLVIGDSYRKDILPAREVGCRALWLKGRGWTADEDAVTDPAVIGSLEDVLGLLKE